MSASSHTAGTTAYAAELHRRRAGLAGAPRDERVSVNDSRALRLETLQSRAIRGAGAHGLRTPTRFGVVGHERIADARRGPPLGYPLILKHNRGGQGPLGVRPVPRPGGARRASRFRRLRGADRRDHRPLVQRYASRRPRRSSRRLEFVGGRFLYAVRVDTSEGLRASAPRTPAPSRPPRSATPPARPSRPRAQVRLDRPGTMRTRTIPSAGALPGGERGSGTPGSR